MRVTISGKRNLNVNTKKEDLGTKEEKCIIDTIPKENQIVEIMCNLKKLQEYSKIVLNLNSKVSSNIFTEIKNEYKNDRDFKLNMAKFKKFLELCRAEYLSTEGNSEAKEWIYIFKLANNVDVLKHELSLAEVSNIKSFKQMLDTINDKGNHIEDENKEIIFTSVNLTTVYDFLEFMGFNSYKKYTKKLVSEVGDLLNYNLYHLGKYGILNFGHLMILIKAVSIMMSLLYKTEPDLIDDINGIKFHN